MQNENMKNADEEKQKDGKRRIGMLTKYPRIEALRAARRVTQDDIAKALGVSRCTAWRKLNGEAEFTVGEVLKLKELLGTTATIEELLSDSFPD